MIAVELAARVLKCKEYANIDLLIRSDNAGIIDAFMRGRSRNLTVNDAIRRINLIAMAHNIVFTLSYIPTADNLADPLSRGEHGSTNTQISPTLDLPEVLWPFLSHEY